MSSSLARGQDLTGMRFGRLVVLGSAPRRVSPSGETYQVLDCQCDCGATKAIRRQTLVAGRSTSCGCLTIERARAARRALRRSDVTYTTAHQRVHKDRGPAATHTCACGEPAAEWAYLHNDPDELTSLRPTGQGVTVLRYSVDPAKYRAMCKLCHAAFDTAHASGAAS